MTLAAKTLTERHSRVDDAYGQLKADILSNALPPGFQAPEPEIAARLGMSRTPVREALLRLQSDGLVELIPRRGARILPIVADDMREIYEILTSLEPDAAAKLAERRLSEAELAPLEQTVRDMEAALEAHDLDAWAKADDAFHRRLLKLHGNARLEAVATVLFDQAHRARIVTLRLRELPKRSTEDHRDIITCLRNGDGRGARRVFREHRQRAAQELLNILENYGLPPL